MNSMEESWFCKCGPSRTTKNDGVGQTKLLVART